LFICPNNAKSVRSHELQGKISEVIHDWIAKSSNLPPSWGAHGIDATMSTAFLQAAAELGLKFDGLFEWPKVVWSLGDVDTCKNALAKYKKCVSNPLTAQSMDRIGHKFCGETSALLPMLEKYIDGNEMDEQLHNEYMSYRIARLDDSSQESPHAVIKKILNHATASTMPWWSATERLSQNLALYNHFKAIGQATLFHAMFASYKALLQKTGRRYARLTPCHMPRKQFLEKVSGP
jgi:hypothetical protein